MRVDVEDASEGVEGGGVDEARVVVPEAGDPGRLEHAPEVFEVDVDAHMCKCGKHAPPQDFDGQLGDGGVSAEARVQRHAEGENLVR